MNNRTTVCCLFSLGSAVFMTTALGASGSVGCSKSTPNTQNTSGKRQSLPTEIDQAERIPEGSFTVAWVKEQGVRFAEWEVRAGGEIEATDFVYDEECALREPAQRTRISFSNIERVLLPPLPLPDEQATSPHDLCLLGSPEHARVGLPGQREIRAQLQWYGSCWGDSDYTLALLSPEETSEHFALLIARDCRSPEGGSWAAPTIGDIDGDGRDDIAFIAHGVGTCGGEATPDCPLTWLDIVMTKTHTRWATSESGVLITYKNEKEVSRQIGAELYDKMKLQWSGHIERSSVDQRGRYEVTLSGPSGQITWFVVLGEEQRLVILRDPVTA